ncbi:MAG: RNA ligase family protein [Planctomycetota bacterium]
MWFLVPPEPVHLAFPKIPAAGERSGGPGGSTVAAPAGAWVALEKLHGAQLVIVATADDVRVGKRKEFLRDDESFFGWQTLRADLLDFGRRAVDELASGNDGVTLYGELFGGHYPHPDVEPVPGLSAVQTGIWYAPGLHWAMFDVRIGDRFLAWSEVAALAGTIGALTPPVVSSGTRATVDATSERFASRVPALLALPALPAECGENLAEGLVVRPDVQQPVADRVIHKRKIAEFDERQYDGSAPFDPHQRLDAESVATLGGRMINAARLASARSKCGDDNPQAVFDEVVLDVLIDLTDALPAAMAALTETEESALREQLAAAAVSLPCEAPHTARPRA